jgi:hypothetical protein
VRLEAGVRGALRALVHVAGVDVKLARRHLGFGRIVASDYKFRIRATDYLSESGMKWIMSGRTKRQCDRALAPPRRWTTRGCP